MAAAPRAWAQVLDHDLKVSGVWAEPDPLSCPSRVCAKILAKGYDDDAVESGQVEISFQYQHVGSPKWVAIGAILVTWDEWENGLAQNQFWPSEYYSDGNGNCVEFEPAPGSYRFRATVAYLSTAGFTDGDPSNNRREGASVYSTGLSCFRLEPPSVGCGLLGKDRRGWRVWCGDRPRIPPELICQKIPDLCEPIGCDLFPEFCGAFRIDLCKFDPLCGDPGLVEVLFDASDNGLDVLVADRSGDIVARMETLRRPITVEGVTFGQRLRFHRSPGESYSLTVRPGKETGRNRTLPFPLLVRFAESGKKR